MRIQVIANCQARPISNLLPRLLLDCETLEPIILHLAKPEDRKEHLEQIANADLIFAQLTQDAFRAAHLSTPALKEKFGEKVVVWPNIFFMGQQPYLRYFTHNKLGRMMGPLEAMHDLRLYHSWKSTGRVDPAAIEKSDPDFVDFARKTSLKELQTKEAKCDVAISDFLTSQADREPLFYTFNHPNLTVLGEMARRILTHVGETTAPLLNEEGRGEPLSRYQVPSSWTRQGAEYQGDRFVIDPDRGAQRLPGTPQRYSLEALCQAYQEVYDAQEAYQSFEGIRLTPAVALDQQLLADL
jgi:hypothetical protein